MACVIGLWPVQNSQLSMCTLAGDRHGFFMYMALYAFSNACIGANLVACATDVMLENLGGFGLGSYFCAGDLGEPNRSMNC